MRHHQFEDGDTRRLCIAIATQPSGDRMSFHFVLAITAENEMEQVASETLSAFWSGMSIGA